MGTVTLTEVCKRFGQTVALEKLSLEIRDEEFVILLGPSGCGKTTALRCIAGLEKPDSGDIKIDGHSILEKSPKERDTAMVFQNYALYPHMTVYDNMAFPLKMRKMPKSEIQTRVKRAAELLQITDLLSRKPKQLSGGQQQRVALGRALVRQPQVFLMDEPLSNLDAQLRLYMRAELKRLQKDIKITTIYVTHDQVEAMTMGDRVATLNKGLLQQFGTPDSVYFHPSNLFVARFIGSPPINLIPATIVEKGTRVVVDTSIFSFMPTDRLARKVKAEATGPEVILGIRPDNMRIGNLDEKIDREMPSFECEIYVVEPLGTTVIYDVRAGENSLKISASHELTFAMGQRARASFEETNLHIFDKKTGNTIT